jgi:hypothetical protein
MRRLAVIALLASACIAAPAHAGWRIQRATAIAATVWHDPCAGSVRLAWASLPIGQREGTNTDTCTVTFSSLDPTEWMVFCTTTIHAYGHLAGYRDPLNPAEPWHSHNPRSVMYADRFITRDVITVNGRTTEEWTGVDRRCRNRGRPYLEAHGLL